MRKTIIKFIPTIVSIVFWVGFEMSGIEIPWLGRLLMVLAVLLLLIPGWAFIKNIRVQKRPLRLYLKAEAHPIPLLEQVYSQISGACHIWKNAYILYYPGHFSEGGGQYLDVWEHMEKTGKHVYSEQEWLKYRPLFDQVVIEVTDKLLELMKLFSDSIEQQFKMRIYQTIAQLKVERDVYLITPTLIISLYDRDKDKDQAFKARFSGVIRYLATLSREADKISARNRPKN
ncbi:MAG: hypothetical protein WCD72_05915 [Dehalococcoidia bacterium]